MSSTKPDRAALTDEIEITPEMIEVGIGAYSLFDFADPAEWVVTAIYDAMEKKRRRIKEGPS